jgi:hypothetical protein
MKRKRVLHKILARIQHFDRFPHKKTQFTPDSSNTGLGREGVTVIKD